MKTKTKDKCLWKNQCTYPFLCCNFCKENGCGVKCKDEASVCKYLTDTERTSQTKKASDYPKEIKPKGRTKTTTNEKVKGRKQI